MSGYRRKRDAEDAETAESAHNEQRQRSDKYGIYLPPHVCRDRRLSPAQRIVFGQIIQLASNQGFCNAHNMFLAEQCGVNRDTVSAAISKLQSLGLVEVDTAGKGRRIRVKHGRIPQSTAAESIGDVRKTAEPTAEKDRGHLNKEKKEEDKETASSSSSTSLEGTPEASVHDYDVQEALDVAVAWAEQVVSMLSPRVWKRQQRGGDQQEQQLGVPSPGRASRPDIDQLVVLALELWPDTDPVMALRQLLRAGAWTAERRNALQQYAYMAASGALTVRGLLRIGGKPDPLAFAREAAGALPPPPPRAVPVDTDDPALMQTLAYDEKPGAWTADVWAPCWVDAAARCRGWQVPPQVYMAVAFYQYEQAQRSTPLPWLSDSVDLDAQNEFTREYGRDRVNAWSGGPCSWHHDSTFSGGTYDPRMCVGRSIAEAVAQGDTDFRSRSCLLCAAAELQLLPGLVAHINWSGTAGQLVGKLEQLADVTTRDDPPIRGVECGRADCGPPSLLRCRYGNAKGIYSVDHPSSPQR